MAAVHAQLRGGDFAGAAGNARRVADVQKGTARSAALSVEGTALHEIGLKQLSGGKPQIVYFDGRNNDMKHAWQSGDGWQSRTVTEEPGALGFHNEVVISGGTTYAACYDYTNRTLWFESLD